MKEEKTLPLLVALVGPTASGKSALGVWLAEHLNGEIVACDSTQLYRGFDIGTAKPSPKARRGIPHHLLDVLDASEEATAGGYRQLAIRTLEDLRRRGRLPVFTVGTGLYLRALLEGLAELPKRSEELRGRLRSRAVRNKPGYLHRLLRRLDPVAAKKIAPSDEQKLIRAVEICLLAQKPLTQVHKGGKNRLTGWRTVKLGLLPPREALYERIHARTGEMLSSGWIEEARHLMASGCPENAKPFDFIGYAELRAVVRGEKTLDAARAAIHQATRRYAKRQLTWFRKERDVHWLRGFGDDSQVQKEALEYLETQGFRVSRAPQKTSV